MGTSPASSGGAGLLVGRFGVVQPRAVVPRTHLCPPRDAPRSGAVPLSRCPLSPAPTWEVPRGGLGCARGLWGGGIRWREMQEPTLNCFGDKPSPTGEVT